VPIGRYYRKAAALLDDRGVDRDKNDFPSGRPVYPFLCAQPATVVAAPYPYIHLSSMSSYANGYISREQRTAVLVWPLISTKSDLATLCTFIKLGICVFPIFETPGLGPHPYMS
jgi:hypothetical protein